MATEKTVNYTPEQTAALVEAYNSGTTVESLAETFGKSVRSIVAKLSREGVYKRKEYVTKNGEKPVAKDSYAEKIGQALGLSEPDVDSLTKANKSALRRIAEALEAEQA